MNKLEERNLIWNLIELIMNKHNLKIDMEMLNPQTEFLIEFGDFVSGHPMDFSENFELCIIEIERKLPNGYKLTTANCFGTSEGCIGVSKI